MDLILKKSAQIKLVIFDVDGVLTDGSLFIGDDGQEYKAFNSKDGLGMKLLQRSGVAVGIITARQSNVVKLRMESLGIEHLYQGQQEKLPAFEQLLEKLSLDAHEVAYVGDDFIDLPIMIRCGLAIAVADSHERVIEQAHWVTERNGGRGAAREVCELIMAGQGTLESAVQKFLK
ncbi:MAG: 3-deoxy-manno-octulosonate-8-phosphatase KdsC [Chromatiales bacterium]|nr:3-deoxy-manno-octulosonate-8-phosphatase KdsC [Chromatiales bacterium]